MIQQSFGFVSNDAPRKNKRESVEKIREDFQAHMDEISKELKETQEKEQLLKENVKLNNMETEEPKQKFKLDINTILPRVLWILVFASFAYMGHTFIQLNQKVDQLSITTQRNEVILEETAIPRVETLERKQADIESALSSLSISNAQISTKIENVENTSNRILDILLGMEN